MLDGVRLSLLAGSALWVEGAGVGSNASAGAVTNATAAHSPYVTSLAFAQSRLLSVAVVQSGAPVSFGDWEWMRSLPTTNRSSDEPRSFLLRHHFTRE